MKATLEFQLPEEQAEFDRANKAFGLALALYDVSQELLRPARKHGYAIPELATLMAKNPDVVEEFVGALESAFYKILEERGIDLDTLVT